MRFQVFGSRALPWFWATLLFVIGLGAAILQLLGPPGSTLGHRSPSGPATPHAPGLVGEALAERTSGVAAQPVPAPARDEVRVVTPPKQWDQQSINAAQNDHSAAADQLQLSPQGPESASAEPAATLPKVIIEALLSRGEAMVATGNIARARMLFERAATGGSARAAAETARMYDPEFLASIHVRGIEPDASLAASWYRRAAALGDSEADARLRQLIAQASK
jgi:hypothetical protein